MKDMRIRTIVSAVALAWLAAGCTYPFDAELESGSTSFVVEGDINIGGTATFTLSNAMSLSDYSSSYKPSATVWVESEDGIKFHSIEPDGSRSSFNIDLTTAPDNCRYRVVIKNHDNGKTYMSRWEDVHMPPVLDSISYKIADDKKYLNMFISFHNDENSEKYYRWSYREEWQYHAPMQADYYYVKPTLSDEKIKKILSNGAMEKIPEEVYGQVLPFDDEHPSTYYCWDNYSSKDIMLVTTEDLSSNRIVNEQYESIYYTSTKTNYRYRTTVQLQSMSRECYQYWTNILNNSENTGSLDSPVPSQMAGNLYCEDDPDEMVIGYVNVGKIGSFTEYFSFNRLYFFSYASDVYADTPTVAMEEWYNAWKEGMLPLTIMGYKSPTEPLYGWAPLKCVQCSYWGGSLSKRPSDWPDEWPVYDY